jgi:glycosyltransferase involved in cell wall biosynthesis
LLDDPDLRVRYGAAGRARVASEFTAEVMGERIRAVYTEALSSGR